MKLVLALAAVATSGCGLSLHDGASQLFVRDYLDNNGAVFEVSGCNQTTLYVCAHPRDDGGQGPFSASVDSDNHVTLYTDRHADTRNSTSVEAMSIVTSSVVCMPGTAPR